MNEPDDTVDDDGHEPDYNTGPFCRHYSDPSDCDERCARPGCGHACSRHHDECNEDGCECPEWVEPE